MSIWDVFRDRLYYFRYTLPKSWTTYIASECQHESKQVGLVDVHGEKMLLELNKNSHGGLDFCLECIANMSIRCGYCSELILVDNAVAISRPQDPNYELPKGAVATGVGVERQIVGCLLIGCASGGMSYSGNWAPPGVVVGYKGKIVWHPEEFQNPIHVY